MDDELGKLADYVQKALDLVQQHAESQVNITWAEHAAARFRLWSQVSGVFLPGRAALSHRLRLHEVGWMVVRNLLDSLDANSQTLCNILDLKPLSDSGSSSESESESADSDDEGDPEANAKATRERIEEDLATLVSYTSIINQKSRKAVESRAYDFEPLGPPDADDSAPLLPLITQCSEYVQLTLQRIIGPSNWSELQRDRPLFTSRLVQTIIRRWRRLSYLMARSRKEAIPAASIEPTTTVTINPKPRAQLTPKLQAAPSVMKDIERPTKAPTLGQSEGWTLKPDASLARTEKPQATTRTATVAVTSSLEFPPRPDMRRLGPRKLEYRCPYCNDLRTEDVTVGGETRAWQQHLMSDLAPYICTYEDCDESLNMFASFQDWMQHHEINHLENAWACNLCAAKDDHQKVYKVEAQYIDHMVSKHDISIADTSLSRRPQLLTSCVLCGDVKKPVRGGQLPTAREQHDFAQNCAARHLKEYSLVSLPWHFEGRNHTGSNQAAHTKSHDSADSDSNPDSEPADVHQPLGSEQTRVSADTSTDIEIFDVIKRNAPAVESLQQRMRGWDQKDATDPEEDEPTTLDIKPDLLTASVSSFHEVRSPLEVACRANDIPAAIQLLSADPGLMKLQRHSALLSKACGEGKGQLVQLLLAHGADLDVQDSNGETPLIVATREQHFKIVQDLVEAGADLSIQNHEGKTAFDVADEDNNYFVDEVVQGRLYIGNRAILDYLRSKTPAPPTAGSSQNTKSPLQVACASGDVARVRELLSQDPSLLALQQHRALLLDAYKAGHDKIVKVLTEASKDLNNIDENQQNPLTVACASGNAQVVKDLIENRPYGNESILLDTPDLSGKTPLTVACSLGHTEVVRILIDHGANVDAQDITGQTPLAVACEESEFDIVRLLVEAGADITARNVHQRNALESAKISDIPNNALRNYLRDKTKDLESAGSISGQSAGNIDSAPSPLRLACASGDISAARGLLDGDSDLLRSRHHRFLLHDACATEYVSIVELLLEKGASGARHPSRGTPFDIALRQERVQIALVLVEDDARRQGQTLRLLDLNEMEDAQQVIATDFRELAKALNDVADKLAKARDRILDDLRLVTNTIRELLAISDCAQRLSSCAELQRLRLIGHQQQVFSFSLHRTLSAMSIALAPGNAYASVTRGWQNVCHRFSKQEDSSVLIRLGIYHDLLVSCLEHLEGEEDVQYQEYELRRLALNQARYLHEARQPPSDQSSGTVLPDLNASHFEYNNYQLEIEPSENVVTSASPVVSTISKSVSEPPLSTARESEISSNSTQQGIEAAIQAEGILLRVLESLPDPVDLFSAAMMNKGMYRVFKENETSLVRNVQIVQNALVQSALRKIARAGSGVRSLDREIHSLETSAVQNVEGKLVMTEDEQRALDNRYAATESAILDWNNEDVAKWLLSEGMADSVIREFGQLSGRRLRRISHSTFFATRMADDPSRDRLWIILQYLRRHQTIGLDFLNREVAVVHRQNMDTIGLTLIPGSEWMEDQLHIGSILLYDPAKTTVPSRDERLSMSGNEPVDDFTIQTVSEWTLMDERDGGFHALNAWPAEVRTVAVSCSRATYITVNLSSQQLEYRIHANEGLWQHLKSSDAQQAVWMVTALLIGEDMEIRRTIPGQYGHYSFRRGERDVRVAPYGAPWTLTDTGSSTSQTLSGEHLLAFGVTRISPRHRDELIPELAIKAEHSVPPGFQGSQGRVFPTAIPEQSGEPSEGIDTVSGQDSSFNDSASSNMAEAKAQTSEPLPWKAQRPTSTWDEDDVARWARAAGLDDRTINTFREARFNGQDLLMLKYEDFNQPNLESVARRQVVWKAIEDLRTWDRSAPESSGGGDAASDNSEGRPYIDALSQACSSGDVQAARSLLDS